MAIGASIGERLAHLINRKGLSDSDLAKVLHINRSTLSRIINGSTEKVSAQLIVDAAQYFGVSTDFLLGLTDIPAVHFSGSILSDSLRTHEPQNARLPVHHQLPEFTQTHVHRVSDAIQPSHPLSSPSPPAPNPSQHQSLFQ